MFESYPDLKSAFVPFRQLNNRDADYEKVLKAHGLRVLLIVDEVLTKQRDEVITLLHDLGRQHLVFNARAEHLDVSMRIFVRPIYGTTHYNWALKLFLVLHGRLCSIKLFVVLIRQCVHSKGHRLISLSIY
jgi:hypothetical protein